MFWLNNVRFLCSCFLNPETNFIWAFILPVLVIILVNVGFLMMAAVTLWQHKKKRVGKLSTKDKRNWLKISVSLVVVMGVTWIFGVLIVEVEALLPLAYIYTILVAFQGFWIFLVLVVLPKQVRNEYHKWLKAKVKESDRLSKFTGQKNTVLTEVVRHVIIILLWACQLRLKYFAARFSHRYYTYCSKFLRVKINNFRERPLLLQFRANDFLILTLLQ